jgi:hypothetical protein
MAKRKPTARNPRAGATGRRISTDHRPLGAGEPIRTDAVTRSARRNKPTPKA